MEYAAYSSLLNRWAERSGLADRLADENQTLRSELRSAQKKVNAQDDKWTSQTTDKASYQSLLSKWADRAGLAERLSDQNQKLRSQLRTAQKKVNAYEDKWTDQRPDAASYRSLLAKWADRAGFAERLVGEKQSLLAQVAAAQQASTLSFWVGVMATVGVGMVVWALFFGPSA